MLTEMLLSIHRVSRKCLHLEILPGLQDFTGFEASRGFDLPGTSWDLLGPDIAANQSLEVLGILRISYDFAMILVGFYYEFTRDCTRNYTRILLRF